MKKFMFILIAIFSLITAKSQIVNICGTDTIILEVENYDNKGVIEWQESIDSINWVTISETIGEIYKFFPTETKYYRAVVKTSTCDPLYSAFCFVQLPPIANAGVNKVTGASYTILQANRIEGSIGEWKVITGSGGVISDITNPNSQFSGITNQEYSLVWTLTNACGQTADTVNIKFEENVFNKHYIVVDNTDSLFSDSTEMNTGLYRIRFSDPTITPSDSVLLLGMREDVSFLRKVTSFTLQDSVYSFITEQGTIEDLLLKGTINFGDAINQSISEIYNQSQGSRVKKLETFPTRKTLNENAHNKDAILLYSDLNIEGNGMKIAQASNNSYVFQTKYGKLYYDLYEKRFDLNVICEYNVFPFHVKFGFNNSNISLTHKIKFDFNLEGIDKIDQKLFSLFQYVIAIPPGIIIHVDVPIKIYSNIKVVGGPIITRNDNYSTTFSTYIESSDYFSSKIYKKISESHISSNEISPFFQGGIQADFKIGPELQFRIFDVLIPYAGCYAKANFDFRTNTNLNSSGKAAFGLAGNVGVKCEIPKLFSKDVDKLFDFNQVFTSDKYSYELNWPNKIELISGNNQKGTKGSKLSNPIVLKVTDSFGNGIPITKVWIQLENGDGTVQFPVLQTDLLGQVKIDWTLGTNNECRLKAYVLDYENEHIKGSPIYITAYSNSEASKCENSNLAITLKANSTHMFPHVSGGAAPYTYSKNGIDFSSELPQFSLATSGYYTVYVKDYNLCSTQKTFTINAPNPCANTALAMDIVTTSNSIFVTGKSGTPPYLYSLDNKSDFSANNVFSNLTAGYYTVYIKDSNGCIASGDVNITGNTSASIRSIYPIHGATSIPITNLKLQWSAAKYAENQLYTIDIRKQNEPPFGPPESDLTVPEYTIPQQLDYGSTYFWEVRVTNPNGQYLESREFSFTTTTEGSNTIPDIPILYFPENNSTTESLPQWFVWGSQFHDEDLWLSQFEIFAYDLYLDNSNATRRIANNISDTTFIVNSLIENQTYYWKVVVKNTVTGEFKVSPVYSFIFNKSGEVFNPTTGKTWMDRNLGASRVAISSTDSQAYGDLYQWGRGTDGHEKRTSQTTSSISMSDTPSHGYFITSFGYLNWQSPQNDNLWQGVNGINNPCPKEFRIPTIVEWESELESWGISNSSGAFDSPLKLPMAGYRYPTDGTLYEAGSYGYYWSSTVARNIGFSSSKADLGGGGRGYGLSVRCIKDDIVISLPELTTNPISSIKDTSAVSGGTIISDGGAAISSRGVVWSTSQNPSVCLSTKTTDGSGTGIFTSSISGLNPNTTYFVRAYATNSTGTAYGNQISFTTFTAQSFNTVTSPTGRVWMDRNLGASRVATSSTDDQAYGDLYQWGRNSDGHEKRTSQTTSMFSSSDSPGHGKFIFLSNILFDWRSPQNNNLWQGVNGINNPCPEGFRIPTIVEWEAELASWGSNNSAGAFASLLKLPVAGHRSYSNGSLYNVGSGGYYWSGTVLATLAQYLYFSNSDAFRSNHYRESGVSVRCIKD
jgi:uncharacterized protein (TIGR02145 family)